MRLIDLVCHAGDSQDTWDKMKRILKSTNFVPTKHLNISRVSSSQIDSFFFDPFFSSQFIRSVRNRSSYLTFV